MYFYSQHNFAMPGHKCEALNCIPHSNIDKDISSFQFPLDSARRNAWLHIYPTNFVIKKASRLCSKHFSNSTYQNTPKKKRKKLFPNAIPDDILDLCNDQHSLQPTPNCLPVECSEIPNTEVETSQSSFESSVFPLNVADVRTAWAQETPKKRWQRFHFGVEDVEHSSHEYFYPLIDDEMRDEDVDAVLDRNSAVHFSLKRKIGNI